jgi:hypothetical protein
MICRKSTWTLVGCVVPAFSRERPYLFYFVVCREGGFVTISLRVVEGYVKERLDDCETQEWTRALKRDVDRSGNASKNRRKENRNEI